MNTPKPTQVDLMEKLCKKLQFKYENKLFANPMLASFYSNLEALVYDEAVAEVEDVTLPRCDDQDKKLIKFIDDMTEEFGTVIFDNGILLLNLFVHLIYPNHLYCDIQRIQKPVQANVPTLVVVMQVDDQKHQRKTCHTTMLSKPFAMDG